MQTPVDRQQPTEDFKEFLYVLRRSMSSLAEEEKKDGQTTRRRAILGLVGWIDRRYPDVRHWKDGSHA